MILFFVGLCLLDGHLDGSLSDSAPDKPIQASIFCILIALVTIPAQLEFAALVDKTGMHVFKPVTIAGSVLLATGWYWRQFYSSQAGEVSQFHLFYILLVSVLCLFGVFIYQARRFGTSRVVENCGVSFFSIFYLGMLGGFSLAVRVDFGVWGLLMFIFTVKSSDIGAYTIGRLFGRHKFSPKISPKKTWEGLAGAVVFASIVSVLFSVCCGIMSWQLGIVFGAICAYTGQLGDLAESMIKRSAGQKDSSDRVPGFGGVLDIIDSPLVVAPVAYIFFLLSGAR